MSFGYQGKILHVHLNHLRLEVEEPEEAFYRKYLGGSALGLYYVLKHTPPGCDPLGPENTLVLAPGILTGIPVAGQSRLTATAKSPLTGAIGDSQSGGYFPAELKFAGFDAIILHGRAENPVYLKIVDGKTELLPADHLWGRDTGEVEDILKNEIGYQKIHILQTGIAGENGVRFSSMISMANRANGRTGLGAVMAAKNLKAVVVRGKQRPEVADPAAVKEIAKWGAENFPDSDIYGMGIYGTAEILRSQDDGGGLPTRNWHSGTFANALALDGTTMADSILKGRDTCYACMVRCKRVVENLEKEYRLDPKYGGPEYETLATFGSYCGVDNLKAVALANQLCNRYGMDTISCGATIAWAMDCYRQGILTKADTGGIELDFGNADLMVQLVEMIARREGFGNILADGSAAAARKLAKGEDLVVAVKGQELPAHMPEVKRSLGLIYAVNPFGADHQSSEHDPNYKDYPERALQLGLDDPQPSDVLNEEKVRYALTTQWLYSAMDSVTVCQFVFGSAWHLYDSRQLADLVQAVSGWDFSVQDLLHLGEIRLNLLRVFNAREGIDGKNDTLPKKLFQVKVGGKTDGISITRQEFENARSIYYRMAGWDEGTGLPSRGKLEELGLGWAADLLDQVN